MYECMYACMHTFVRDLLLIGAVAIGQTATGLISTHQHIGSAVLSSWQHYHYSGRVSRCQNFYIYKFTIHGGSRAFYAKLVVCSSIIN